MAPRAYLLVDSDKQSQSVLTVDLVFHPLWSPRYWTLGTVENSPTLSKWTRTAEESGQGVGGRHEGLTGHCVLDELDAKLHRHPVPVMNPGAPLSPDDTVMVTPTAASLLASVSHCCRTEALTV